MQQEKDDARRVSDNLKDMRNMYQQILQECAHRIPQMKKNCSNERGNIVLGHQTINWLVNKKYINAIRKNFFFDVKTIASEFGNHPSLEEPTIEAMNALSYQLKDIILWFNDICKKYPK